MLHIKWQQMKEVGHGRTGKGLDFDLEFVARDGKNRQSKRPRPLSAHFPWPAVH